MHVSMMLLSYTALLLGSLFSIALLVITFRKNIPIFSISKDKNFLIKSFFSSDIHLNDQKKTFQNTAFFSFPNSDQYQFTHKWDYWSDRVISLGFLFFTIGILYQNNWSSMG
jgi:ABC-type transport system involved in cytochrome c biogenesis permease subunit